MSKNDASAVRCYGKMHRPDAQLSCQQILNDMTTSELNEYFGPRGDPLVNVGVPFLLLSGEWGLRVGFWGCLFVCFVCLFRVFVSFVAFSWVCAAICLSIYRFVDMYASWVG